MFSGTQATLIQYISYLCCYLIIKIIFFLKTYLRVLHLFDHLHSSTDYSQTHTPSNFMSSFSPVKVNLCCSKILGSKADLRNLCPLKKLIFLARWWWPTPLSIFKTTLIYRKHDNLSTFTALNSLLYRVQESQMLHSRCYIGDRHVCIPWLPEILHNLYIII